MFFTRKEHLVQRLTKEICLKIQHKSIKNGVKNDLKSYSNQN